MNGRKIIKFFAAVLSLIMVINNISYAINISKDDLKKSLKKIFGSNIRVETKHRTEMVNSDTSFGYTAPTELNVTDSQIILRQIEDGQEAELKIDYSIENNTAKFSMKILPKDLGLETESPEELALSLLSLLLLQGECMTMAYLAVSDSLGLDLNTVASYYDQLSVTNAEDNIATEDEYGKYQNFETDLFKSNTGYNVENEPYVQSSLEINLDKLAEIDSSMLDGTVTTTVIFLSQPEEDDKNDENNIVENNTVNEVKNDVSNNTVNNTINNVVNNTVNNVVNNVVNNTVKNTVNNTVENKTKNESTANNIVKNTDNQSNTDNTVSETIIPKAGGERIAYIVMGGVIISLLIYIKYRQYDDVK